MSAAPIIRTVQELRAVVCGWKAQGLRVGLVPTMGALHNGHMSLVRTAAEFGCDRIILTIFVNPTQFGPTEDLDSYPRQEQEDVALASENGVALVFAPNVAEMYGPNFATAVSVSGITDVLCGARRPVHFGGVATVVTKLLNQAQADAAFFGEKDYQQLCVIRRLASDLDIPTRIVGVPTLREDDGLAMSSRNKYLSTDQRQVAGQLNKVLFRVADAVASGESARSVAASAAAEVLSLGFQSVDYLEVRDAGTLEVVDRLQPGQNARVFVAAQLGQARLIDNIPV